MNGVDVPFHVVHIVALVITHRTCKEPLPLLAVHLAVVNLDNSHVSSIHTLINILQVFNSHLEIMFIGTFEGAVSASMFVLVHLHKKGSNRRIGRTKLTLWKV